MPIQYHLLTIRKNNKLEHVSKEDIDWSYHFLNLQIPDMHICHEAYEVGKYKQLHYHAVVTTKWALAYRRYPKSLDLHIHFRRLKQFEDIVRAIAYLYKEQAVIHQLDIKDKDYPVIKSSPHHHQDEIIMMNWLKANNPYSV